MSAVPTASPEPRMVNGFPVTVIYNISDDTYRIEYMGEHFDCPVYQKTDQVINAFCNCVFKLNGGKYGISGQAASSHAGNSAQAQLGNQGAAGSMQQWANQNLRNHQILPYGKGKQFANQYGIQAYGNPADESSLAPLKTEGVKLGEIIAVRGWKVTANGFLRSMTADVIWAPHEPMEGKTSSTREHCGIYAYKTARDFLKAHPDLDVYGKVALWGDVIEHELGYRAEFAKIISIDDKLRKEVNLSEIRERYCHAA